MECVLSDFAYSVIIFLKYLAFGEYRLMSQEM